MKTIKEITSATVAYLIICLVFVIVAYPVFWMLISSLKPSWEVTGRPFGLPSSFDLGNYIEAWKTAELGRAFLNSLIVLTVSITGILLFSSMGGYVFAKLNFRGKKFLFYFWLMGMMVPPHVTLLPNFIIMNKLGLINSYFSLFFIYFASTSFGVFVMRSFFYTVPSELLEAAIIDGSTVLEVFWRVAIPLARGGLTVIAIFYFVFLWNDFMYPLTFLRSETKNTITLALMSFQSYWSTNWGPMMAALSMASLPSLVFYFVFQRHFIKGMTAGALKG